MRVARPAGRSVAACVFLAPTLGACSDVPGGVGGPQDGGDPAPAVFDWVGRWVGEGTGSDEGTAVSGAVELLITFDARAECELCVRVRLGHLFDRDSLLITDPIQAALAYVDDEGLEHRLDMQRHTTGGLPGTTILGRVEVGAPSGTPGAPEPTRVREFVVTKEVR